MILWQKGDGEQLLTVTLKEKQTLDEPYFLFVFEHVETFEKVKFIKAPGSDESNYKDRYNQWTIDVDTVFLNAPVGEYEYYIYEQASSSNTDETLTTSMVEQGKMLLKPETAFDYTGYNPATTYVQYEG